MINQLEQWDKALFLKLKGTPVRPAALLAHQKRATAMDLGTAIHWFAHSHQ